jgi:hypothetical protein
MEDYAANSRKSKEIQSPKKEVQRVVTGEVVVQPKPLGRKFRELFIEADFKSVNHYVIFEVILPGLKNMFFDASTKGIERMIYGESAIRRRNLGSDAPQKVIYNTPVSRSYATPVLSRSYERTSIDARSLQHNRDKYILSTRVEAENALYQLNDIIEKYEVVSVADLLEMIGQPHTPVDNRWGWINLDDARIQQVREGFLLNLPQAEPMQ